MKRGTLAVCGLAAGRVDPEAAVLDAGEVAGRLRDDRVAADGLPELGDVNLERRRGLL
jgi:hypothetical protein